MRRIILPIVLLYCAAGCADGGDTGHNATTESLPDSAVIAVARADAAALSSAAGDVNRAENLLFEIHAKEHFMRSHGLNATADLYIKELTTLGAL